MTGSRRRPPGNPGRSGVREPGGNGRTREASPAPPARPTPAPVGPDRGDEIGEHRTARQNRHRALALAGLVGLIPGAVVAVALVAVGVPVVAAAAFVVVVAATGGWVWVRAPVRVVRALQAAPSREDIHPRLHNLVDGLCASMGLPRPAIFVIDHDVPNALAVGHDPSSARLIVTSGLEERLSLVQLEGVLAHELVHVKRGDIVLAGVAAVALVPWSVVVGVARASEQVHALVGRGREFTADQRAAAVVRYPPGIGSALGVMADRADPPSSWPPGRSRTAALTRWLWIDPVVGAPPAAPEGNLDDTRVRAEALSLR